MKILMLGDCVGRPGREIMQEIVPKKQRELGIEMIIANGENASGGKGLNRNGRDDLFRAGVDVITMGNHTWDNRELAQFIDDEYRIVRPANYPGDCPGRPYTVYTTASNMKVAVINLLGRVFMQQLDCPFAAADQLLKEIGDGADYILVDFHAETTSEKLALGYYLDGRVSAVVGTHTHVQTADERILPEGTAYISDLGMTGVRESVLGVDKDVIIKKFLTGRPVRHDLASGRRQVQGVIITFDDDTFKATAIERISWLEPENVEKQ